MSFRRILLIQVRDSAADRDREQRAFTLAAGRFSRCFRFIDAFHEAPDLRREDGIQGVIIAGSALSVFEPGVPHAKELAAVVEMCVTHGWPLLGICFGAQFIAHALGGSVIRDKDCEELGTYPIKLRQEAEYDLLLRDLPGELHVQQAHQDRIVCLPEGGILLASSELCNVQAFRMTGCPVYGLQFHPERSEEDMRERLTRNLLDRPEDKPVIARASKSLRPTPEASGVVSTFIERVVFGIV